MIVKRKGSFVAICDICGNELEPEETWQDAADIKKKAGWHYHRTKGIWEDWCDECEEKAKSTLVISKTSRVIEIDINNEPTAEEIKEFTEAARYACCFNDVTFIFTCTKCGREAKARVSSYKGGLMAHCNYCRLSVQE